MKEIKTFIIVDIIIFIIKVLGGILCHSYTFIISGLYDLLLAIISMLVLKKSYSKAKGILTSIIGFIFIISSLSIVFFSIVKPGSRTSLFILIFIILSIICRYLINCYYTNLNYQKVEGFLSFGNINSNFDFIQYGIIILSLILMKISKYVSILKYSDIIFTILIATFIIVKSFKIISNSFNYSRDKELEEISPAFLEEIEKRKEVNKLQKVEVINYSGIRYCKCKIVLNNGISMIDINSFILTLQDYLLKISDVVEIEKENKKVEKVKKPKVKSKKIEAINNKRNKKNNQSNNKNNSKKNNTKNNKNNNKNKGGYNKNARNSGSGNSKKNTQKKNNRKKNKKR